MGRVVGVRGAGAVRVARDELLALLAFVVHRVAQRARQRHQEANERDAEDEDAAREVDGIVDAAVGAEAPVWKRKSSPRVTG